MSPALARTRSPSGGRCRSRPAAPSPGCLWRRLLKGCFRRLDGKIAVSPAAMRLVAPHFPGYYNIIPNGVDVERFSAPYDPLSELDDGMLNILFVGRLRK